jgi:hypothetical protein
MVEFQFIFYCGAKYTTNARECKNKNILQKTNKEIALPVS